MEMLIDASTRAGRSLLAPGMPAVFLISVIATIGALLGFIFCTHYILGLMFDSASAIPLLGTLGATFLAWALFPGIMPIIVNFFDEHMASLIERQDYPNTIAGNIRPFWPEFWHDVRFTGVVILLNIIVLPFIFFPPLYLILFYGMNGYLLGREFFTMAARRHISLTETTTLRRQNRLIITAAGVLLTVLATIPFLNLLAPFWGVAVMVHLYHKLTPVRL